MTARRLRFVLIFVSLLIIWKKWNIKSVWAAGQCSVTVTPTSVQTNSDTNFGFWLTNSGTAAVTTIRIVRPSTNFDLQNYGVNGWNVSANNEMATLTGGSVSVGSTLNFYYHAVSGASEATAAEWRVYTNDGSGEVECSGSKSVAIVGARDITPPYVSDIRVTEISSTGATISWITDELSTTYFEYGLDEAAGIVTDDPTMSLSHSITLVGLTADTTYYYYVSSTDASGNYAYEGPNSFTTAAAVVATPTPTPTTSITVTVTPTPTATTSTTTTVATPTPSTAPVVQVDLTKPTVVVSTQLEKSYEIAPTIEGSASDNKLISKVEFSTDNGLNWLPVGAADGLGTGEAIYSFTPQIIEDGNYEIKVRAFDNSGNEGISDVVIVVIDRLPPRVGGVLLTMGPYNLLPNKVGVIVTMAGIEQKITMSAVGGPTSIDLLAANKMFSLGKSAETGLWRGAINFANPGTYELKAKARDGAGNETERIIGKVLVIPGGRVSSEMKSEVKGKLIIYVQDKKSGLWTEWDGKSFGQSNPQTLDENGGYKFYLPPGTYYGKIETEGEGTMLTQIFELSSSTPLNADFEMKEQQYWHLGPFRFPIPLIFAPKARVELKAIRDLEEKELLVGAQTEDFTYPTALGKEFKLSDFRGDVRVLTFINSWSPAAMEQIRIFDEEIYSQRLKVTLVATQESAAKMLITMERGGYKSDVVVDRDGELVEPYQISAVPRHYLIDRSGVIREIVTGIMSSEELMKKIEEIR